MRAVRNKAVGARRLAGRSTTSLRADCQLRVNTKDDKQYALPNQAGR